MLTNEMAPSNKSTEMKEEDDGEMGRRRHQLLQPIIVELQLKSERRYKLSNEMTHYQR